MEYKYLIKGFLESNSLGHNNEEILDYANNPLDFDIKMYESQGYKDISILKIEDD